MTQSLTFSKVGSFTSPRDPNGRHQAVMPQDLWWGRIEKTTCCASRCFYVHVICHLVFPTNFCAPFQAQATRKHCPTVRFQNFTIPSCGSRYCGGTQSLADKEKPFRNAMQCRESMNYGYESYALESMPKKLANLSQEVEPHEFFHMKQ